MTDPSDPPQASAQNRRALVGVIVAMAVIAMLYGYTGPLFSIVLEDNGASGSMIGLNGAVQMAGVFVVLPFLPGLIRRFGPAPMMITAAGVAFGAITLMGTYVDVWLWFLLRFAVGAAQTAMWTTGETWVNHLSDDRSRSRTISIFMSVVAMGYATGPFVLAEIGAAGFLSFLMALAVPPLLLGLRQRISADDEPSGAAPSVHQAGARADALEHRVRRGGFHADCAARGLWPAPGTGRRNGDPHAWLGRPGRCRRAVADRLSRQPGRPHAPACLGDRPERTGDDCAAPPL